jgi:hypothetical protein
MRRDLAHLDALNAELDDDGLVVVTAELARARYGFELTKAEAIAFAAELVRAAS